MPDYAGDAYKAPAALWRGSRRRLDGLVCTDDCRRCSVCLVWSAGMLVKALSDPREVLPSSGGGE